MAAESKKGQFSEVEGTLCVCVCVRWIEESGVYLQAENFTGRQTVHSACSRLALGSAWHRCLPVLLLVYPLGNRIGSECVIPERCTIYEEASLSEEENWAENLFGSRVV